MSVDRMVTRIDDVARKIETLVQQRDWALSELHAALNVVRAAGRVEQWGWGADAPPECIAHHRELSAALAYWLEEH